MSHIEPTQQEIEWTRQLDEVRNRGVITVRDIARILDMPVELLQCRACGSVDLCEHDPKDVQRYLPSVGRIQSYCGRTERPHDGHVWTSEPRRWCTGDEAR